MNTVREEKHLFGHALIFPGLTRASCFVKPGKMRARQVMISGLPAHQAASTRLLVAYAFLHDQQIYDTSSIPDAETRNLFPALSRESLASVTTALATSSVVTFAPIFLIKSAGEIPREEAYASIAAFPSSVSGMMRPGVGVSARNCKPSCKRADSFWA